MWRFLFLLVLIVLLIPQGVVLSGNLTDYAAHIEIDQPGDYAVSVQVEGPVGTSKVDFTQSVSSPRNSTTLLIAGIPFLILLAALGGWWFLRSGTRAASAAQ